MTTLLKQAHAAGMAAFAAGQPSIPARDKPFVALINEECPTHIQRSRVLAGWLEGWKAAATFASLPPAWPLREVNAEYGTEARIMPLPPYVGRRRPDYRVSLWDTDAGMEAGHVFVSDITAALATARTIANVAG